MKMEQTECSETSAYKIQTPGNYPEENIQHTEHGESLKSRTTRLGPGEIKTGYLPYTQQLLHQLSQVALYLISCCIAGTSPKYVDPSEDDTSSGG